MSLRWCAKCKQVVAYRHCEHCGKDTEKMLNVPIGAQPPKKK